MATTDTKADSSPKKNWYGWTLYGATGLSGLVYKFSPGSSWLNMLFGVALVVGLIASLLYLFKQNEDRLGRFDTATNLVRNFLEIAAITAALLIGFKSSWFHDFFMTRTVEINGIVWDESKTPKEIVVDKELKFLFEFLPEELDSNKNIATDAIFLVVKSENGMLKSSIKLENNYHRARVKLLQPANYKFYGNNLDNPYFRGELDFGYRLHFSPALESLHTADGGDLPK